MVAPRAVWRKLRSHALTFPDAYEDHPWDETVAKVNGKIFVFFGTDHDRANVRITVKLDESHDQALMVPGAKPAGYGLGRSGWVSVPLGTGTPPVDVLRDWIDESYRRVAPKRLVAELDARSTRGRAP